jgi:hypothetical protein
LSLCIPFYQSLIHIENLHPIHRSNPLSSHSGHEKEVFYEIMSSKTGRSNDPFFLGTGCPPNNFFEISISGEYQIPISLFASIPGGIEKNTPDS